MRRGASGLIAGFVALLVGLAAATAPAVVLPLGDGGTGFALEPGEGGGEVLVVRVGEVRVEPLEIEGLSWAVVRVPGAANLMERGWPSLPYLSTEYLLGPDDGVALELLSVETREVDLADLGLAGVAPSKGHFNRSVDPESVPWEFDPRVYASDVRFPADPAWVDPPFIAGPLRGQALRVPVAHWQAASNRLEVVVEARYKVERHDDAANPRRGPQPAMTQLFDQVARLRAVNYDQVRTRYVPFVESGRLLVLTPQDFLDEVQPLVDWEVKVGYPTVVETVPAGVTASQVMTVIQNAYNEPEGLTWVILVGDYQQIPNFTGVNEGAPCDPCYTKLEGGDNRPDAAISRLSAQNAADLVTQVNKILTYEQLPGLASTWYDAGFGIGGDDTGGTGLADWERVDLLRTDLTVPNYTFTEFDQIYHSSAQASQVTTAVNLGRSLGVYIGHGWDGGWSTTGFDTSDVHALTNGDMLPSIWSVACNNGQFHNITECFAEGWLRKQGGGAVSFEGGTTSESWVPPCDGQRGIVDSIRQEVAFTTGGQHVNGKQYCMDLNGATNSSEGTKWMEQSTLFGSCVMWPRTVTPMPTQEPDDFALSGGVASLTVKLAGGGAYGKVNGAIVSFYTLSGRSVQPLGSGLIDANGVVHATVSGDPTHCHIHGFNLVPAEYELAARPAGRVSLDHDAYPCDGTVSLRVVDSNVGSASAQVTLAVPGSSTVVTLAETPGRPGFFAGTATLGVDLQVSHGQTLTATYVDADDGQGGVNLPRTDDALVDCQGPVISGLAAVEVGADAAVVGWATDESSTSWAQASPGGATALDAALVTAHALEITGLEACHAYTVDVASADAVGNGSTAGPLAFTTLDRTVALDDDVESGPGGWTVQTAVDPPGAGLNWSIVEDPAASSPTHSWFTADEGAVKDDRLQAGPFTLGSGTATLRFAHHYALESGWDGGVLEVSTDGSGWQDVVDAGGAFLTGGYASALYSYGGNPLAGRQAWTGSSGGLVVTAVDLTAVSGGNLWLRFRHGSDGSVGSEGWWVDDIRLETTGPCTAVPLFADDFESGDCGAWSVEVP